MKILAFHMTHTIIKHNRFGSYILLLLIALTLTGCDRPTNESTQVEGSSSVSTFPGTSPITSPDLFASTDDGSAGPFVVSSVDLPDIPLKVTESDYPWWRGWNRADVLPEGTIAPVKWSEKAGVVWRTPLSYRGHGTPTIVGSRIYIPTADTNPEGLTTIYLYIIDRAQGKVLDTVILAAGQAPYVRPENSHASGTIASDGERLYYNYVLSDKVQAICLDMNGKKLWTRILGPFSSIYGFISSPLIYGSTVIFGYDSPSPGGGSLTAFDRQEGNLVWKVRRPLAMASFSSPCLINSSGKDQLIMTGARITTSYNPANGETYWYCNGPADTCCASPAWDDQYVYLSGGTPQKTILAVKTDGTGDVTDTHIMWTVRNRPEPAYVCSMVLKDGLLFVVNESNELLCIESSSGAVIWSEKLTGSYYSSPVIVGSNLYIFGCQGQSMVFKVSRVKLRVNSNFLGSGVWSNPVFLDGGIYIRTLNMLYFVR